jgi:hypothetical protein
MPKPIRRRQTLGLAVAAGLSALGVSALRPSPVRGDALAPGDEPPPKRPDVLYLGTPPEVVDAMLDLAVLTPGDVLYDLGCGDGRIVVAAAKRFGVKAVGLEIDPKRVRESLENVRRNDLTDLVTITRQDIFEADLTTATVVTMYLLPTVNVRLMPQLSRLGPGSRVISHSFTMKGAKPVRSVKVKTARGGVRTVYLWVVPWEKE